MDPQRLAARGDNFELWAGVQKLIHDVRAGFHQMFAIIENEQKLPAAQIIDQNTDEWSILYFAQIEHRSDGRNDERGIVDGRKFNEPHSVFELTQLVRCDLKR